MLSEAMSLVQGHSTSLWPWPLLFLMESQSCRVSEQSPVRMPEGWLSALPLTSCVILNQWLNVSVPVSSNGNGNNTDNLMRCHAD